MLPKKIFLSNHGMIFLFLFLRLAITIFSKEKGVPNNGRLLDQTNIWASLLDQGLDLVLPYYSSEPFPIVIMGVSTSFTR